MFSLGAVFFPLQAFLGARLSHLKKNLDRIQTTCAEKLQAVFLLNQTSNLWQVGRRSTLFDCAGEFSKRWMKKEQECPN